MSTVIVDIDGTLLNSGIHPIQKTINYVNKLAATNKIVIVTGRPESERGRTTSALRAAGVRFNRLIMNNGSTANSNQYKKETAKKLLQTGTVSLAIENNPDARAGYSSLGIKTMGPSSVPVTG